MVALLPPLRVQELVTVQELVIVQELVTVQELVPVQELAPVPALRALHLPALRVHVQPQALQ